MNDGHDRSRDDALSYDPHSWIRRGAPDTAAPPAPPRRSWRHGPFIAAIGIALVGAGVAWRARPAHPVAVASTRDAPRPASGTERRTLLVADPRDLAPSLSAIGLPPRDAAAISDAAASRLGKAVGEVRLELTLRRSGGAPHVDELILTRTDGGGVRIVPRDGGYAASAVSAHLTRRLGFVRGVLDGESFYSSAVAAGVADTLIADFANAFRYDFDLQREVASGDVFEAGFEQRVDADGHAVGDPVLVYAALTTAAKARALYLYDGDWIDAGGRSTRRALMRTPVEAARISSGFGMRGHPILGYMKMHRGIDFAAPTGTPIFAAGDATVSFAGPKGPNGNFVKLHHPNGWDTLYLHMNRIWPGVAAGAHVAQGQQIGEVGTTGRSTGPHLHYEVHVDGEAVDPQSIDTGAAATRALGGRRLAAFQAWRDRIDAGRVAGT